MKAGNELRKIYADYNKMLKTEAGNEIPVGKLNFKKCVIGSDEAGNGEIFKPWVTVAVYVSPKNIDKLIELAVQDSKEYGKVYEKAKKIFYPIGEQLTGFTSYKDFEGKEEKIIRTDYVTFAASVLLNSKFNKDFKPGNNFYDLFRHEHKVALLTLAEEVSFDYMAIDDFQGGGNHDKILKEIDIQAEQAVIVKKADSMVMAVSCASVIAYYLTNLYVDALDKMLESEYGISIPLVRSANYNTEAFQAPLKELKKISEEKYEKFLEKYAKKYYIKNMKLK